MRKVVGHVCLKLSLFLYLSPSRGSMNWKPKCHTIRSRSVSMVIHLKTNRFNCQNALLRCVEINNTKSKQCVRWIDGLTSCVIHDDDDWRRVYSPNRDFSRCHQRISAPLDQFSTHCVSRVSYSQRAKLTGKSPMNKNGREEISIGRLHDIRIFSWIHLSLHSNWFINGECVDPFARDAPKWKSVSICM